MNERLVEKLACPKHKLKLSLASDYLICPENDRYLVVDGIPVLLFDDGRPAHGHIKRTLDQVNRIAQGESLETVVPQYSLNEHGVDKFVEEQLHLTCGNLYFAVQKHLTRYPFPELRLPPGNGQTLLDIGCSWGRWTVSAARKGYWAVGIDPHLDGVLAAKRIAAQVGVQVDLVVGDTVHLPFLDDTFENVFSFSVMQHLAKSTVGRSLADISRITVPGGKILIQLPNRFGIRALYGQAKKQFRSPSEARADVFYWTPDEMKREFGFHFGPTELLVDSFFGLNLQSSDADLMPLSHRAVIRASEIGRKVSRYLPMKYVADSLYVSSINKKVSRSLS